MNNNHGAPKQSGKNEDGENCGENQGTLVEKHSGGKSSPSEQTIKTVAIPPNGDSSFAMSPKSPSNLSSPLKLVKINNKFRKVAPLITYRDTSLLIFPHFCGQAD